VRLKTTTRLQWLIVAVAVALLSARFAASPPPAYPPAPRGDVVDDYHGTAIADPYRWLESADSPATVNWVNAESRLTHETLDRIPGRDAIRRRLSDLSRYTRTDVPWREAGRIFFLENGGDDPQSVLYEQDEPGAAPRRVLDPRDISPDGSIAVGDFVPSPDGRWLAYSQSGGGGDETETRVRELASGREQNDVVRGTIGGVSWTFDGAGFFYAARPERAAEAETTDARMAKRLCYHVLGEGQESDRLIQEWSDTRWLYVMSSDDGRWAIAVTEQGPASRMHILDLGDPAAPDVSGPLLRLLPGVETRCTPMGTVGSTLYVFNDLDAPRGRVIALDLTEGAAARPREVIAQGPNVIQWATVAGDRLALHYLVDVKSRLFLYSLDGTGAREVPLPGVGEIGWPMNGRTSSPELWYSFESFLAPATVYRLDLATGKSAAFRAPRVTFDAGRYETRQVFFASKDGTRVPMFITARRDLRRDGSHPVLLMSYGANGLVTGPAYRFDIPLWLERGGIYAVANPRGGGEYGEEWHRAGNLENKQNSLDDFIAAAEYLVAERYTVPAKIAIYGHSSGGLLIGAVMTQRPDLFGVALPDAGHYDMLRYHKFTVGSGWIPEYGSPDDSTAFRWLLAYSPLHHVQPGVCYPATLLLAADHDDTVVPSHAYKFAAALQAAQGCDRPILLHISHNASHLYASRESAIDEMTDVWAFTIERTKTTGRRYGAGR